MNIGGAVAFGAVENMARVPGAAAVDDRVGAVGGLTFRLAVIGMLKADANQSPPLIGRVMPDPPPLQQTISRLDQDEPTRVRSRADFRQI
jgi:hypothetical protein